MLREIALNHISACINRLLATDPLFIHALSPLRGKCLAIHCLPLKTPIFVLIGASGIQLKNHYPGEVTVSLKGKAMDLLTFIKSPDQTQMLMDERVKIHGEVDFLLKLKRLATTMDLDIEGLIALYLGDTAAVHLHQFAKSAFHKIRATAASFATSTTLYLSEESGLLPTACEVEHFICDVNQLRQDLERACARTQRLSQGS